MSPMCPMTTKRRLSKYSRNPKVGTWDKRLLPNFPLNGIFGNYDLPSNSNLPKMRLYGRMA